MMKSIVVSLAVWSICLFVQILTSPSFAQTINVDSGGSSPLSARTAANSMSTPTNVLVTDFNSSGIELVPYTSPEFRSLLTSAVAPTEIPAIEILLPYSVLIKNGSSKSIIAHTVSWASRDKLGKPFTDFQTVCDLISLRSVISAGTVGLASPLGTLNNPAIAGSQQWLAEIGDRAQTLRDKASVTISLDLVIFEDGSSIGMDASRFTSQAGGRLRAERDLYKGLLDMIGNGDATGVTSWLEALAAAFPPGSTLHLGSDPLPAYQYFQARLAASLLSQIAQRGLPETVAYVRSVLSSKVYPPLLVN